MSRYVAAIDQGTTSTRFLVFDHAGCLVGGHQLAHEQILPGPGLVEHNALEIHERTRACIETTMTRLGLQAGDLAAVGVTNQRETTIVWDRRTGRPIANAVVWQDTRTAGICRRLAPRYHDGLRRRTGLPLTPYFSATKLAWLLQEVDGLRARAQRGDVLFGTPDSWLVWQLTGGRDGGRHLTDVTNASRTLLLDLETLQWDAELLDLFDIPAEMLPSVVSSADTEAFGCIRGLPCVEGVPIAAVLGDQQAATVGQRCFTPGSAKNTYGTGNFLVLNTGRRIVHSRHGLLSTVAYRFAGEAPVYALEGSIAVTGSAVQWLRDQLGIIRSAAEIEALAERCTDTGGLVFVPAFSGLFAPYWRPDARGVMVGLSRFHTGAHIARATLEAICHQSRDVVDAMGADTGLPLRVLHVDGGVTANNLCMQIQADVLGIDVSRPVVAETTALGAAYAAGLATGFWSDKGALEAHAHEDRRWSPAVDRPERDRRHAVWRRAVERTFEWADPDEG